MEREREKKREGEREREREREKERKMMYERVVSIALLKPTWVTY